MWLYLWILIEWWVMVVNFVRRPARCWCFDQGLTRNHANEGSRNNLGLMLYSVYAVCFWSQLMIMTWREWEGWLNFAFCNDDRVVAKEERDRESRWDQCGGYNSISKIRGTNHMSGLGRPHIGQITCQIRICTNCFRNGKLTRNSVISQFLMMTSPISTYLTLSRPQLYHHLRTHSEAIPLYLPMQQSRLNTEYSVYWV